MAVINDNQAQVGGQQEYADSDHDSLFIFYSTEL